MSASAWKTWREQEPSISHPCDLKVRIAVSVTSLWEIAILGQSGLDYASSEQKYRLASLPGETFSGLQLMRLMYVGFKDIQPTLDVGMALQLHQEQD